MKKEYDELKKKYQLPEFKELDADFQISSIEAKNFVLKEIVKKMTEKIEYFSTIFEEILSPERLSSLNESSMFNEQEKKKVLRIYRKLHFHYRQNTYLEINYEEKETADFIKEFFNEWQDLKPDIKLIVARIKNSWNSDKKSKLELSYFG